ncbi:hypothetical protein PCANC_13227 [Puccinia coronata f. sp. avenae]|uniref:Uncharacterized protein n=1 Tax=Puccinia coronata f. sp. avenae TaxID=200324 RepID=A0A2N5V041_9BASI|nr:hypothetical protein PCANC_13227 [Puccinia coronata f. sp. avenae]
MNSQELTLTAVIAALNQIIVADKLMSHPTDDTQTPASQRQRIEEPQTPPSQIQPQRRVLSHDPFGHSPPAVTINLGVVQDGEELPSSHLAALFTTLGVAGDLEIYAGELAETAPSQRAAALITTIAGLAKRMNQISQQILAAPTDDQPINLHKQDKLKLQSPPFKRANLPPKFLKDNNHATQHVHAHVKTQLKHVRHKVQNVLMTGVNPTPNISHLPPINKLCRLLWQHFKDENNTATDKEINEELKPRPWLHI